MRRQMTLLGGVLACLLGFCAPAVADVIRISSGSLSATGLTSVSPLILEGDRGFTLNGDPGLGVFSPWDCSFEECRAGDRLDLRAFWSGLDLISTVTLEGVRFDNVGSASSNDFALAEFRGGFALPEFTAAQLVVRAPFSFEGQFGYFDLAAGVGRTFDLLGGGTATVTLTPAPFAQAWSVERIEYLLAGEDTLVTPEPATLLLVGGGLAWAARRRHRRRTGASAEGRLG